MDMASGGIKEEEQAWEEGGRAMRRRWKMEEGQVMRPRAPGM